MGHSFNLFFFLPGFWSQNSYPQSLHNQALCQALSHCLQDHYTTLLLYLKSNSGLKVTLKTSCDDWNTVLLQEWRWGRKAVASILALDTTKAAFSG